MYLPRISRVSPAYLQCISPYLDHLCLLFALCPQKPEDGGERTPEEAQLFKQGLAALPLWYGHAETVMWMQPDLPEGFGERMAALGLAQTYEESGWCFSPRSNVYR